MTNNETRTLTNKAAEIFDDWARWIGATVRSDEIGIYIDRATPDVDGFFEINVPTRSGIATYCFDDRDFV